MSGLAWSLVLLAGGYALLQMVSKGARSRAREASVDQWNQMLKDGTFTNEADTVRGFLIPDAIHPPTFFANYAQLTPSPDELAGISVRPSPSIAVFQKGANAPLGYPRWFLAAYPDVVLWVAQQADEDATEILVTAFGMDRAMAMGRSLGPEEAMKHMQEEMNDDEGQLRPIYLRGFVDLFRKKTNRNLECSI